MHQLIVYGNPIAQPRVRVARRGKFSSVYTPQKKIGPYKDRIKAAFVVKPLDMIDKGKPIAVRLEFVFELPKSRKKTYGAAHTQKPDVDNLCKAVFDALNELAWHDDCQIVDLKIIAKRWQNIRHDGCIEPAHTSIEWAEIS